MSILIDRKFEISLMLTLATFRTISGHDEVAEWFDGLDEEDEQPQVLAALLDLLRTPRVKWARPEYGQLKGDEWKGFREIILRPKGIQIRLVGYWRTVDQFAVVMVHNKNKSGRLSNKHSKIADKRRKLIEGDPTSVGVWLDENAT
jgi:hypothetical protein